MIQVLELPLRVTSIHRLDNFKPFFKVEDWTHRRSRFSRSLSLQTNSSVDTDPILTYEIVGGGGGGPPPPPPPHLEMHLRYDICNEARQIEKMHMHIILWNRGKYSQSHYSPRLKRIVVLVYAQKVQFHWQIKSRESLSFRKQQRNGLNGNCIYFELLPYLRRKVELCCFLLTRQVYGQKLFVVSFFAWSADKNDGSSVARGNTSSSCSILFPIYLKRRIHFCKHLLSNLFVIKILRFLGQIFLVEKPSSRNGLFYANKRKLIQRAQNSATVHRKTPFWVLWSLFLPYCAFQKHANSKVQTPPSQLRFWLPSIIITIISNEPWNTETHKTDENLPITNQKPWPFEPVKVKFCFLKLRSVKVSATLKNCHFSIFEISTFSNRYTWELSLKKKLEENIISVERYRG